MKKTLATILMMVCFAATFAFDIVSYERPENADVTTEGKWLPASSMFVRYYTPDSSILKHISVRMNDRKYMKKEGYGQIIAVDTHEVTLFLKSNNSDNIKVRYEVISSGNIILSTKEYTLQIHDYFKNCHFDDLDRHLTDNYVNFNVYEEFTKPFVDALYVGNDIIFYIRDNNGNSESVYIEADGFGKTMEEL